MVAHEMEAVLGIEVHAQLATRTKAFCRCPSAGPAEPNSRVCPTCLGLPGALPMYNRAALELAVAASLALGCTVHERSVFARKNYFYPDLPKGYQISQLDQPLATGGRLEIEVDGAPRTVRITRLHLEEDAGKLTHAAGGASLVDLCRAGTPLAEIVTEPDLRSAAEAAQYLRELRSVLLFVGACDGNLEEGSFRADVNVSIRPRGSDQLGTRVELKNLNSFRFVERAVKLEIERQTALVARGERVLQETRGYDDVADTTIPLRSKEDADDYRYVPDPDLPPLLAPAAWVASIARALPPLPGALRQRFVELGVSAQTAQTLLQHPALAALFEQTVRAGAPPVAAANFVAGEIVRDVVLDGLRAELPIDAARLAELLSLVASGSLSLAQAKTLYAELRARPDASPRQLADELGMAQLSDEGALRTLVTELVQAHPKEASAYRAGRTQLLGFFVGKVMAATHKRANPEITNRLLRELLDA